jgi:hypothetical protein
LTAAEDPTFHGFVIKDMKFFVILTSARSAHSSLSGDLVAGIKVKVGAFVEGALNEEMRSSIILLGTNT